MSVEKIGEIYKSLNREVFGGALVESAIALEVYNKIKQNPDNYDRIDSLLRIISSFLQIYIEGLKSGRDYPSLRETIADEIAKVLPLCDETQEIEALKLSDTLEKISILLPFSYED